jgi:hypothetical protein
VRGENGEIATLTAADRRRGRVLVGMVFVVVWGLITHGTFAGSGDEPHYMMIAHSLAFDGDLDLTNDYRDATLIGGGTLEAEPHAIQYGGRLRPVHDVGMPLALAPVVRIAYIVAERLGQILPASVVDAGRLNKPLLLRHQISLVMALLTGLLARELFLVLLTLGGTGRTAFGWALLFALTPPIVSHSFLFFTEIPSALMTLFAFRRLSLEPVRTVWMAALVGALTGFLLLVHARNVGIVAGLVLVAVVMVARGAIPMKLLAAFLMAASAGALGRTATTYLLWGAFVTTPHAAIGTSASAAEIVREIFVRGTGLLFDREHGLVGYGPVYLLAGPGLLVLWRGRQRLTRDLWLVLACYLIPVLLPMTNVHGWRGGWSPAARFLVPISPLLWLGVYMFAVHASRGGRLCVAGLVTLQVAIDAFVWQFPKTLWNDGDGVSALRWTQWLPTWIDASATLPFALALGAACAFSYVCSTWLVRPGWSSTPSRAVPLPPSVS